VEVINLAQVQKDVSNGYADRNLGNSNNRPITINGTRIIIATGSSLNDIREAINDANTEFETGVTASIIFDGEDYRMVLSGEDANTDFNVNTNIRLGGVRLRFSTTQDAELAEINVDGINITSSSNTINNAIPGISIDLLRENVGGESTTVNVDSDNSAISEKVQAFVTAYNDITTFVNDQKDADWGNDASLRSVRRTLQNLLVTTVGGTGNLNHLVDIGFKTNAQTGLISIDSAKLETALSENYDDFEFLLLGDDTTTGIFEQFTNFLDVWTDNFDGLYAGKKQSHDSSIRSIDASIERLELRLAQREITLTNQFAAMEELVSGMNSTSTYLSQQMTMLAGLSQGGNN
jgi:flagellar hook-associated protein 2